MKVIRTGILATAILMVLSALVAAPVLAIRSASSLTTSAPPPSQTYSLCSGTADGVLPSTATPEPAPSGGFDEVIRQADNLVMAGQPDAAAELYRLRLTKDPTDQCAARGLAFIAASSA